MNEPAPKDIIQSANQPTKDLHQTVSGHLNELGHPATPQSVDPHDESSLEGIGQAAANMMKDPARVAGAVWEEQVSGESPSTDVGTTKGRAPVRKWQERFRRKKAA